VFSAHRPWRHDGRSLWAVAAFANPTLTRVWQLAGTQPMSTFPDQFRSMAALPWSPDRPAGWLGNGQGLARPARGCCCTAANRERLAPRLADCTRVAMPPMRLASTWPTAPP
jgi:hypothetical protein